MLKNYKLLKPTQWMERATCQPTAMVSLTSQWLTSHPFFLGWLEQTLAGSCWLKSWEMSKISTTWADIWFGGMHVAWRGSWDWVEKAQLILILSDHWVYSAISHPLSYTGNPAHVKTIFITGFLTHLSPLLLISRFAGIFPIFIVVVMYPINIC